VALLLPLVFVAFAEIALYVAVGRAIGVLPTLALTAAAMLAGALVVRRLGVDALRRAEASMARGESPAGDVFDAACVALAGMLLIVPGFLTDLLAVLFLIRPLRRWAGAALWRRLQALPNVRVWTRADGAAVVEGEYVEIVENRRLPPRERGKGPSSG
jgi:UPF0716 protein FxsA